jgi:hypothetical protein
MNSSWKRLFDCRGKQTRTRENFCIRELVAFHNFRSNFYILTLTLLFNFVALIAGKRSEAMSHSATILRLPSGASICYSDASKIAP